MAVWQMVWSGMFVRGGGEWTELGVVSTSASSTVVSSRVVVIAPILGRTSKIVDRDKPSGWFRFKMLSKPARRVCGCLLVRW